MKTQTEIIIFLESLVHKRFTEEELNKVLSDFFGEKIEVYNASQGRIDNGEDDDELPDWNLMFSNWRADIEDDVVDGDIYVLPTREIDEDDNVRYYVTEVGYEFI